MRRTYKITFIVQRVIRESGTNDDDWSDDVSVYSRQNNNMFVDRFRADSVIFVAVSAAFNAIAPTSAGRGNNNTSSVSRRNT